MRRKKIKPKKYGLKTAFIFGMLVLILIIISAGFKVTSLISKSKYDGIHRFTIGVYNPDKNGSLEEFFSFAPDNNSISILSINGNQKIVNFQNAEKERTEAMKLLAVPIDAVVGFNSKNIEDKNIDSNVQAMLLDYKNLKTNLTIIDLIRLWFFARSVPSHSVITKSLNDLFSNTAVDRIVSSLFTDNTIIEEKNSIQIINGTDVPGLGNKMARLITNMGGNVIAVSTAEPIDYSEILYFGEKNYTLERLNKIFGFKIVKAEKQGISDITIKLGKDGYSKF